MKRLEIYIMRTVLVAVLAAIAASPFMAVSYLLRGVFERTLETTHLIALVYILLIALALFLISPVFGESKR